MNQNYVFDNLANMYAIWIDAPDADAADLAKIADLAIEKDVPIISVPMGETEKLWPWLENSKVQIFNRFDFGVDKDSVDAVSKLATDVAAAFRNGACGAQIFVPYKNLKDFVEMILPIRNDLFFDRKLTIGLTLDEVQNADWVAIFDEIKKVNPNALLITASGDNFDAKSDMIGRIYDMLMHWNLDCDLHIMFGKNMFRATQTVRLAQNIRPILAEKMRIFVEPMFIVKE